MTLGDALAAAKAARVMDILGGEEDEPIFSQYDKKVYGCWRTPDPFFYGDMKLVCTVEGDFYFANPRTYRLLQPLRFDDTPEILDKIDWTPI